MIKMISKGYTLWLMPKGKVYNRFSDLIRRLAHEHGGPVFEPHVTLLGDIEQSEEEVVRKTGQLVLGQQSFPVTLRQIGFEDFHFSALFVRAEISKPLLSLHEKAKSVFGMQDIPPYMPHLSLLYGNYSNELKEKIISKIGKDQTAQFNISSVHLIKGGEVKDWQIIKEFPFQ